MLFNQLGEYGLNQLLARRLTTSGPAPSPTVEPAIFPSLVLENDRPEWGYNKGERLCAVAGAVAAVAAQSSQAVITNPVGSNVIACLESFSIQPGATIVAVYLTQSALALTPVTAGVRDGRWTSPRPVCTVGQGASLIIPPDAVLKRLPASTFVESSDPLIIPPGWSFLLHCTTVNVGITVWSASWRERSAQPGEL